MGSVVLEAFDRWEARGAPRGVEGGGEADEQGEDLSDVPAVPAEDSADQDEEVSDAAADDEIPVAEPIAADEEPARSSPVG